MGEALASSDILSGVPSDLDVDLMAKCSAKKRYSLKYRLIDKLETPNAPSESLDIQQIKAWEILDPAKLNDKLHFVSRVDTTLRQHLKQSS